MAAQNIKVQRLLKPFGTTPVIFAAVVSLSVFPPLHEVFGEAASYLGFLAVIIASLIFGLKCSIIGAFAIWFIHIVVDAYMEGAVMAQLTSHFTGLVFMLLASVTVAKLRGLSENLLQEMAGRRQSEKTLAATREYADNIIESSLDMIIAVDKEDRIIQFNRAAQETFGYPLEEIIGQRVEVLYADPKEHGRVHKTTIEHGRCVSEIINRRKNGELFHTYLSASILKDADGNAVGIMGISRDITERKMLEEKLRHNAFYDSLTNLPNRAMFLDRLSASIARANRQRGYKFAVLFIDIDRFKNINDSLGHRAGDQLLVVAGERLRNCVRPYDTIARLGGDEFAVLLSNARTVRNITAVAKRLLDNFKLPAKIGDHDVYATASIGITMNKEGRESPEDILRDADTAMYRAKALGRACYVLFDETMHEQVSSYLQLENNLRRAIDNNEFYLNYQPVLTTSSEIVGFEALLRWTPHGGDPVGPDQFIPVAEETGLIVPLGEWALREACRQMNEWHKRYPHYRHLTISVNLSTRQFSLDLPEKIMPIILETGIEPGRLLIEITESAIINNPDIATEVFLKLRNQNIRVQMDDFGTGYSSLGYLHRYAFDALKIDRSFVSAMCSSSWAMEIVKTIITMAHNMKMEVIAEGVETLEQLEELRKLHCDYYQGYWYSKPIMAKDAEALLEGAQPPLPSVFEAHTD